MKGKRGHSTFSGDCIFLGRPWGLRDESSPSFSAVLEVQAFVPNGVPRLTQWRIAPVPSQSSDDSLGPNGKVE